MSRPSPFKPARSGRAFAYSTLGAAAVLALCASAAQAFEIDTGNPDLSVRWDNNVRANLAARVNERDSKIGNSALSDEGTYSFDKGELVAKRFDLLSEFDLVYKKRYGFRVSGAAWYDGAYGDTSKSNPNAAAGVPLPAIPSYVGNQYSSTIKRLYGKGGEIMDAFVFGGFDLGEVPVNAKLGRHTLYWGESVYLGGHMHSVSYSQSPLDLQKGFATPGTEVKELFRPLNQISAQAQLTDTLSVSAQYLLEWESARYPEGGTYLGPVDFAFNGPDRQFLPIPGLGFGYRGAAAEPAQRGEYGLSARWSPAALDGTIGFYYRNFADKLPQVFLTKAAPANGSIYNMIYADRIQLFGASITKNIGSVSTSAEVSYRHNTPLSSQVLGNAQPLGGFPQQGETPGPRGDTWHGLFNVLGTMSQTPLFDAATYGAELQWMHLSKVSSGANLFNAVGYAPCNVATSTAPTRGKWDGCATTNYAGVSFAFNPTWFQVLPGVDLSAPMSYAVGISGNAATIFGGNQGLGNYTVGLSADWQQKYRFDLKYADYIGRYKTNAAGTAVDTFNGFTTFLVDRGFVSLTFKTTF